MKKTLLLLLTAILLVGTAENTPACANTVSVKIPDTGYDYGYAAGQRYLAQNPTESQVAQQWHQANANVAYYNSVGDTGHADWWQGYADGLQYSDSNSY